MNDQQYPQDDQRIPDDPHAAQTPPAEMPTEALPQSADAAPTQTLPTAYGSGDAAPTGAWPQSPVAPSEAPTAVQQPVGSPAFPAADDATSTLPAYPTPGVDAATSVMHESAAGDPTQALPTAYGPGDAAPTAAYAAQQQYGYAAPGAPQQPGGTAAPQTPYDAPAAPQQPPYGAAGPVPPYAAPGAMPPQGPGAPYGWRPQQPEQWSGLAIAGFIVSFFFGLIGLILSILGLNQTRKERRKGRGLAIAGIVIGVINIVVVSLFWIAVIGVGVSAVDEALDQATQSQTDPNGPDGRGDGSADGLTDGQSDGLTDDELVDGLGDDLSDDLTDDLDAAAGDLSAEIYSSLDDFVASPYFQDGLGAVTDDASQVGITFSYRTEGSTLVLEYAVDDLYGIIAEDLASSVEESAADYQDAVDAIGMLCRTDGPAQLRVYMHTSGGQSIYDRTFVEGQ